MLANHKVREARTPWVLVHWCNGSTAPSQGAGVGFDSLMDYVPAMPGLTVRTSRVKLPSERQ
jgi:hypothetical protein